MKKGSYLVTFGVLALVAVCSYGGFLYFKKANLVEKLDASEKDLLLAEENLTEYENDNVFDAINANRAFSDISDSIVSWSEVIAQVNKMIPDDSIEVLSYSFSGADSVSISVRTKPSDKNPYVAVANLIKVIDESDYFSGIFVPSVSAGVDANGHESLSFAFSIKYLADGSGGLSSSSGASASVGSDLDSIGNLGEVKDVKGVVSRDRPVVDGSGDAAVSR